MALTDIYADGIADVELLGDNVRLIYFTWERGQKYWLGTRVRSGRLPVRRASTWLGGMAANIDL